MAALRVLGRGECFDSCRYESGLFRVKEVASEDRDHRVREFDARRWIVGT